MSKNEISRKDFLKRLSMVGAIGIGSSSLLAACGGGKKEGASQSEMKSSAQSSTAESGAQATAEADPCTDISSLSDAQKKMRKSLQYTGHSPYADKRCDNCNFYTPAKDGSSCGSCSVVAGPINPKGHCTSWVKKQA